MSPDNRGLTVLAIIKHILILNFVLVIVNDNLFKMIAKQQFLAEKLDYTHDKFWELQRVLTLVLNLKTRTLFISTKQP